ncbi:hypothetical protein L484_000118 [Morus notabilis]|uniref:Uncharacterized protein n=1 Tax=Morus notabilis TaxID=981085 RepID=W9QPQ7_9ROSA|nr:hypothetical protein L484_013564 [Morus notabilis]EXC38660.1 hypothetical protein L484_000118 [Morus notabilis]
MLRNSEDRMVEYFDRNFRDRRRRCEGRWILLEGGGVLRNNRNDSARVNGGRMGGVSKKAKKGDDKVTPSRTVASENLTVVATCWLVVDGCIVVLYSYM